MVESAAEFGYGAMGISCLFVQVFSVYYYANEIVLEVRILS